MSESVEEKARKLLLAPTAGLLSTHSQDCPGFPFGSIVPLGFDYSYRPVVLISRLAQHTQNIQANSLLSLLVTDVDKVGFADVQTCARITVLAQAQRLDAEVDADTVQRYCRFYPQAESYYKELDFDFYRLEPEKVRFIAGFGAIHWVAPEQLFTVNPLGFEVEADIVEHMNTDHSDALVKYCQQAGLVLPESIKPEMVGVDAFGFFQRVGERIMRFEFPQPVENANEVRKALIGMLKG